MTDEELIARLRTGEDLHVLAADRIEALVKERDEALEWLSASQGYIADAVFALDKQEKAEARAERLEAALRWYEARVSDCRKITREGDTARHELDRDGGQIARAAIARLKGDDHEIAALIQKGNTDV